MYSYYAWWLLVAGGLISLLFTSTHGAELRFSSAADSKAAFEKTVQPLSWPNVTPPATMSTKSQGDLDLASLDIDMKAGTSAGRWAALLERVVHREMPPPAHLFTTLLQVAGASRNTFGMKEPGLKDLDQTGPLMELLA